MKADDRLCCSEGKLDGQKKKVEDCPLPPPLQSIKVRRFNPEVFKRNLAPVVLRLNPR